MLLVFTVEDCCHHLSICLQFAADPEAYGVSAQGVPLARTPSLVSSTESETSDSSCGSSEVVKYPCQHGQCRSPHAKSKPSSRRVKSLVVPFLAAGAAILLAGRKGKACSWLYQQPFFKVSLTGALQTFWVMMCDWFFDVKQKSAWAVWLSAKTYSTEQVALPIFGTNLILCCSVHWVGRCCTKFWLNSLGFSLRLGKQQCPVMCACVY